MEAQLAEAAQQAHGDPLAAYDVDVAEEGAALEEYLALVQTASESS